jgi:hypothetical protein
MRVCGLDSIRYSAGIFVVQESGKLLALLGSYALPRKLGLEITLYNCIREVVDSNTCQEAGYSE